MNLLPLPAIVLSALLSFTAQAQQPADAPAQPQGTPPSGVPSHEHPGTGDQDKATGKRPTHSLDGDDVPEGKEGDGTGDHDDPGGPHGDGRTEPAIWE